MFELVLRSAVLNSSCSDTLSPFLCLGTLKNFEKSNPDRLMEANGGYFTEFVWVFCTYFGSQYYVKVKKSWHCLKKLALLFA